MFSSTKPILGSGFTHLVRIWCLAMSWSSIPAQWMQTVFSFSIQPRECIWVWAGSCSSSHTQQKQAVDVVSRIQGLAESPPPPHRNETPVNGESNFPPSLRSVGPGGDWPPKPPLGTKAVWGRTTYDTIPGHTSLLISVAGVQWGNWVSTPVWPWWGKMPSGPSWDSWYHTLY